MSLSTPKLNLMFTAKIGKVSKYLTIRSFTIWAGLHEIEMLCSMNFYNGTQYLLSTYLLHCAVFRRGLVKNMMPNHSRLQRIITEGMVNGKRGRGRKRCGWLGNVSRYAGMNINRCTEIATNREEWRTIVSNVVYDKEQR